MTAYRLLVSTAAKKEIRDAVEWWRRERTKAPSALADELRDAFERLIEHPMSGRPIEDPTFRDIRRLSLNRTHYYLFYRIHGTEILILGIRHQSRREVR